MRCLHLMDVQVGQCGCRSHHLAIGDLLSFVLLSGMVQVAADGALHKATTFRKDA